MTKSSVDKLFAPLRSAIDEKEFRRARVAYRAAREAAINVEKENERLNETIVGLETKIEEQEYQIGFLLLQIFGKKSEPGPKPTQMREDEETPEADENDDRNHTDAAGNAGDGEPEGKQKNSPGPLPKRDPRQEGANARDLIELPHVNIPYTGLMECSCGCGGGPRSFFPQKRHMVIPEIHFMGVTQVPRCRCRRGKEGEDKETMVTLPVTPNILPGSRIDGSAIAYFITKRYAWGQPWHRIETMMRFAGWKAYSATMMRRANRAAQAIMGVYHALVEAILGDSMRVFVDETPVPILKPGAGQTGTAFMFAIHRDDRPFGGNAPSATVYMSKESRAMWQVNEIFAGRELISHNDGLSSYGQFGKAGSVVENITMAGCWAHARRNFYRHFEITKSEGAARVIELVDSLYRFERSIWGLPPETRRRERQKHQIPTVRKIRQTLEELKEKPPEKAGLRKSINYMLKRWKSLNLFLKNGCVDLDTNPVERQFKWIQTVRKNVYFIGSTEGGNTWAVFSSLIETCKLNSVDPYRYLVWVFEELAKLFARKAKPVIDYRRFLPWNAPSDCRVGTMPVFTKVEREALKELAELKV